MFARRMGTDVRHSDVTDGQTTFFQPNFLDSFQSAAPAGHCVRRKGEIICLGEVGREVR